MHLRLTFKHLFVFSLCLAAPPAVIAQTVKFNVGDPLRLGMGYNTLTAQYAGNCTVPVVSSDVRDAGEGEVLSPGQLTKWDLTSVDTLSSLSEKLDFSASASASFVGGSVSASTQYVRSRSFNTFHQFLYVDASVANSTRVWTKPALDPKMEKLRQTNPLDFLRRCGDSFVKTVTDGGELSAILDLSTLASEDKSSLSIDVNGNFGTAEGRAQLKTDLQQTFSNRQTKVTVIRNGGTGPLPSYSAAELIVATQNFPDLAQQHPSPMLAYLASYDTISAPASLTARQEAFILPLFQAYRRAMQYSGDLAYISRNTSEFRTLEFPATLQSATENNQVAPEQSAAPDANALKNAQETFALFIDPLKQKVVPNTDFTFRDIDKDQLDVTVKNLDSYLDQLGSLARTCVSDPKNGCSGSVPSEPDRIAYLVRVFTHKEDWNTASGPVSILLDPSWVVKIVDIVGSWRIADAANAPVYPCNASMPRTVTNGYIITGSFDSYYPDNHGICTYVFLGFRR